MNQRLTTQDTVARLAVRVPAASRVFMRHGIDYCCGGQRRLADVCAERGLVADDLLDEITLEHPLAEGARWDERPLGELVAHIVTAHHRPLDEELPRLLAMARKVEAVHGDKDPVRLHELAVLCERLFADLAEHMKKEEAVLFPWIVAGNGRSAGGPIRVMHLEHDEVARDLRRLHELTDDFTPPAGACVTWRALWLGLEALDADLRQHMHLENNVLFPRALAAR
ncbi:MAG: iron-sulfur cluster repair di-iron protein [Myxococcales bacterium]|nr:iron-sulfur cluster repair di-iron protein [Myxococcales bacterium]MCB9732514.1 iron-sulfur cluster repair di-iron protein [Deltaproteobacteria bacterium]